MSLHAQHGPAERLERAVPLRIMPPTLGVALVIDFDDEPHLGAREVDDVLSDDELTTKRKAGLLARQPPPEPLCSASSVMTCAIRSTAS